MGKIRKVARILKIPMLKYDYKRTGEQSYLERTMEKEKIGKYIRKKRIEKVVDKQNNIWYTKRVAAETDNNKEPWKSKIEQYVKPWKFE